MSAKKKIPELYEAEDIRREAYELERMAQLRESVKKIRKLRVLPFVLALPLSVMLAGIIHVVLSVLLNEPSFSRQPLLFCAVISLCLYPIVQFTLYSSAFEERYYDEVERLRRLFLTDHSYWDALKRMDEEYPAVARKIRRMKYVVDPNCP